MHLCRSVLTSGESVRSGPIALTPPLAHPGTPQVDDLVSLLSVPGVDMVNFGATDYSVSIGHPGQDGRPGIKKHKLVEEAELKGAHLLSRACPSACPLHPKGQVSSCS